MRSVLIMGGNQFVGKRLCEVFVGKGYKVFALNRGIRDNINGVIHLKADRNIKIALNMVTKNLNVDAIIDVSAYYSDQILLLQSAMKNKYRQYIFISSASIYNNIKNFPANEKDATGENPIWGDYAKNKFLAEKIIIENEKKYGYKYTIFRPFYIYGIGNNLDRESYIFSRLKFDLPIFIPNIGVEKIQFGYIDDLVNITV